MPSGITLPASTNEESSNSNKRKREDVVVAKAPLTTQKTATSASPKSQNVVKSEDKRLKANLEAVIGTQNSKSNTKNIDGVIIEEIKLGTGRKAQKGERLKMMYVGKLKSNDRIFDASKKPFSFRLGRGEVSRKSLHWIKVHWCCVCSFVLMDVRTGDSWLGYWLRGNECGRKAQTDHTAPEG